MSSRVALTGLGVAAVVGAAGLLVVVGLFAVLGVAATTVSDDVRYQCDSAIGPDPSASVSATPTTGGGERTDVSTPPSVNPYASLQPADGDSAWEVECFSALKDAPYQDSPVATTNNGAAAECAARVAVGRVGRREDQVSLVRSVVYEATTALLTGRCEESAPPVDLPPASTCPDSRNVMLMPDTVAAQGVCGQRAAPKALSSGDLVFWDHRDNGPMRVGIAVGPTELVTADITTGVVVQQQIPANSDIRVKRVLPRR